MPKVKGYNYTYSAGHVKEVLKKVQETGRPDRLTGTYLRDNWLLKNAQYGAMLDVLTDLGFIGANGAPTDIYSEYQNPVHAKLVLAQAIKRAYSELFKTYPDAHSRDRSVVQGFLKQHTGADASVVAKILTTFNALCGLADFDSKNEDHLARKNDVGHKKNVAGIKSSEIPISMNIQIVIPNDATAEQYDLIFSSIKKNLLSGE